MDQSNLSQEVMQTIFKEDRPWGGFEQFVHNLPCTVKILTVKKGGILSLQSHTKRDELWIALDDGAKVERDSDSFVLMRGEKALLPRGCKHRLSSSDAEVRVLEISFGEFVEGDEVRYEDAYGRTSPT